MKVSFFASHGGSSVKTFVNRVTQTVSGLEVGCVITNNENADIRAWCKACGVPVYHISSRNVAEAEIPERLVSLLRKHETDVIFLSGYMKMLPPAVLASYQNIFNIHPSLLPRYGGKGMFGDNVHRAVLENKEQLTGVTIHRVNGIYDDGEIVMSQQINVVAGDTVESLRARVRAHEEELVERFFRTIQHHLLRS